MKRKPVDIRKAVVDALTNAKIALHEVKKARSKLKIIGETELEEYLIALEIILERIVLRLTTMTATGLITRELIAPILVLLQNSIEYFSALPPGIMSNLYELESILTQMANQAPGEEPLEHLITNTQYRKESQEILVQAREEARKRIKEGVET